MYEVKIIAPPSTVLRTEIVNDKRFVYDFTKAIADGGLRRVLNIEVAPINDRGERGNVSFAPIENPRPRKPTQITTRVFSDIGMEITPEKVVQPADRDISGMKVWMSKTSGFTADASTLVYDGKDLSAPVPVDGAGTYYYRVAMTDDFLPDDYEISNEFSREVLEGELSAGIRLVNQRITELEVNLGDASASAIEALQVEVSNLNDTVAAQASLIQGVQAATANAQANASSALTASTTAINDVNALTITVNSQANAITQVTSTANNANATASIALNTATSTQTGLNNLTGTVSTQASLITQVTATANNASVSASQALSTSISVQGKLTSQYTLELNANGYVSGIKAFNNGSTSSFIIQADRFAVASPSNPSIVPFQVVGNVVLINNASIKNLNADNLVTGATYEIFETVSSNLVSSSSTTFALLQGMDFSVNLTRPGLVMVFCECVHSSNNDQRQITTRLTNFNSTNGTRIVNDVLWLHTSPRPDNLIQCTGIGVIACPVGLNRFYVEWMISSNFMRAYTRRMRVLNFKGPL